MRARMQRARTLAAVLRLVGLPAADIYSCHHANFARLLQRAASLTKGNHLATVTIASNADLLNWVGKELPPSDWITVTQEMIDLFAEATGDHQWIHVDVERAKKESPYKTTIAHGY